MSKTEFASKDLKDRVAALEKIINNSYKSTEIRFTTNPSTYFTAGTMIIIEYMKICILRFIDVIVTNNPTANEILYTGVPQVKYQVNGVLINYVDDGFQKILLDANTIRNYWTNDSIRGGNNKGFSGEIVYIKA